METMPHFKMPSFHIHKVDNIKIMKRKQGTQQNTLRGMMKWAIDRSRKTIASQQGCRKTKILRIIPMVIKMGKTLLTEKRDVHSAK